MQNTAKYFKKAKALHFLFAGGQKSACRGRTIRLLVVYIITAPLENLLLGAEVCEWLMCDDE